MKLNKIKVNSLFGVFNHEIPINNESGITIVIGENGLGKTIILEMIEAFFKGNSLYFNKVSFSEIIFEFSDGIIWTLNKTNNGKGLPVLNLVQTNKNKTKTKPLKLIQYDLEEIEMVAHQISRTSPHFRRVGPRTWEDRRTRERFHADEFVN
ncbi:MAG: AAA family ATPase, partial [Ignavibacteriae bacterium]|nr:AAA family ATPase [Ignavibacteriota bacterium]